MTPLTLKALAAETLCALALWLPPTLAIGQAGKDVSYGSLAEIQGQVVAPSSSRTLHSTTDLSGGDSVRWTSYLSSRFPSPTKNESVVALPAGHRWVKGSFRAYAQTSTAWKVSGVWVSAEPNEGTVVEAVKWNTNRQFTTDPGSEIAEFVDMSGVGDGYRITPYKDRLFVVNHHGAANASNPLKCRMAKDGSNCPGWPMQGVDFRLNNGGVLTTERQVDSTGETGQNPLEGFNPANGQLFVTVHYRLNHYIVCSDLNTKTSCGSWQVGKGGGDIISFNQIGNKYYVINNQSEMVCFDVERRAFCEGTDKPSKRIVYGVTPISDWTNAVALGHRLFFMAQVTADGGPRAFCHDSTTGQVCAGWVAEGIRIKGEAGANPWLWADGTGRGVCSRTGYCVDVEGRNFTASPAYVEFFKHRRSGWGYRYRNIAAIQGSRVYAASAGDAAAPAEIGCFDTAKNERCGTWPSKDTDPYTSRFHPSLKNCLMLIGHRSIARILDVSTGGPCRTQGDGQEVTAVWAPSLRDFPCNPARSHVSSWGNLLISRSLKWGPGGLAKVKVSFKDLNGQALPAQYQPQREFKFGTHELAIGSGPNAIPYAKFPGLSVTLTLEYQNGVAGVPFGVELTREGDAPQVCFDTKAPPSPDCQTVAKLEVTLSEWGGPLMERLSASAVMAPGGLSNGYAAVAAATTPRLTLRSLGPRDPRTQLLQGRWNLNQFSGDLWAFDFRADGQIEAFIHHSAEASTLIAPLRPLFTSDPSSATAPLQKVKPLEWRSLSPSQREALNTNLQGLPDTLGEQRLDYLRGVDGAFRPRQGSRIGPVISSAPVVLPVAPFASLPESAFPGYSEYRRTVKRLSPLALFGANDGALHAYEVFDGGLKEAWSYVPDVMLRQAKRFSDATLGGIRTKPHFVDNLPIVGHVDANSLGWRAVAVITYGRGARAITALDVTETDLRKGRGVLFEYTQASHPDLKDLGYVVSQPQQDGSMSSPLLVQLGRKNSRAAVLVGNGLDSQDSSGGSSAGGSGKPVLYAFYLDTSGGKRWERWAVDELWAGAGADPGLSRNNGLSTPTPVDTDSDGRVDVIYAGDQQGNLWRFNVKDLSNVSVTRLFKTDKQQPISQAPAVTLNPKATACGTDGKSRCWQVVFSTGESISPLQQTDNNAVQSIYSVLDMGQGESVSPSALTSLAFAPATTLSGVDYRTIRLSSIGVFPKSAAEPYNNSNPKGWRLDLGPFEHGVGAPQHQPTGLIMFSSVRPTTPEQAADVCIGPRSWLNEVDALEGITQVIPFDTNGDGTIDASDRINPNSPQAKSPQSMAISGAQFGPPVVLLPASTGAQDMALLVPGLGQDTSQRDSWNGGGVPDKFNPTGQNSSVLKHSKRVQLGRMSWREVY